MKRLILALSALTVLLAGCSGGDQPPAGDKVVDMPPKAEGSADTGGTTGGGTTATVDFEKDVKPVVTEYCVKCHSGPKPADDLDMSKIATNDDAKASGATFSKMAKLVEEGKMPPAKGKPLPDDVKAKLISDLKSLGS